MKKTIVFFSLSFGLCLPVFSAEASEKKATTAKKGSVVSRIVNPMELSAFDPLQDRNYLANVQHTGVYTTKGLSKVRGVKWSFRAKAGIRSSPIVVDGIIYIGSDDGHLYALDEATGKEKWKFDTKGKIRGSAAVADGIVYVGSESKSLYALKTTDGTPVWEFKTNGAINKTPTVACGLVAFGEGLNTLKSNEEWNYSPCGRTLTLDASTGKIFWETDPCYGVQGITSLSCDGKNFYGLAPFDMKTGEGHTPGIILQPGLSTGSGGPWTSVGIDGENYYISCFHSGLITAVSKEKRAIRWQHSHNKTNELVGPYNNGGEAGYGIPTGISIYKGLLIYGTECGELHAMNKDNGNIAWTSRDSVGRLIIGTPVIAGGLVYFGNLWGELFALQADAGNLVWKHKLESPIWSTIWPGNDVLYISTQDGQLIALQ